MSASYWIGLDLGQASDYSVLVVVEATPTLYEETIPGEPRFDRGPFGRYPDRIETYEAPPCSFKVRHLERFPLGTSYSVVADRTAAVLARLPDAAIIIDHTGVGRGVFDLFVDRGLSPVGVTITAGGSVTGAPPFWNVPKKDLIGIVAVALQNGRLQIAPGLRYAETLVHELLSFRVKISTAAHASFEAWREQDHDDLVLALGIAAWGADYSYGHPFVEGVVTLYDELPLITEW